MFLVFNKEKIYTYIISIMTVVLLLCVASNISIIKGESMQVSANSEKLLPIYKVKTKFFHNLVQKFYQIFLTNFRLHSNHINFKISLFYLVKILKKYIKL